jgi:O-antigen biosynthesis protein WbqV
MKHIHRRVPRQSVAFLHDLVMAGLSFVIALALRLGNETFGYFSQDLLLALVLFVAVCGAVFMYFGLYRGIWRYASLNDLEAIVRAASVSILIFLAITFFVTRLEAVPRTSLLINWFTLISLLGGPRILYRVFKDRGFDHLFERENTRRTPVVLLGAGDAAEAFIRQMARDRQAPYKVLGVIDEKGTRVGRSIHGVAILGHLAQLDSVLSTLKSERRDPQRIILTKNLARDELAQILDIADAKGMAIARLPRVTELRRGEEHSLEPRPIAIEDLLGRTQAKLDRTAMLRLIADRKILVTGAGGSIGSELVRQIAALGPAHLTLVDNSEFALYRIDRELHERHGEVSRKTVLADVRDRDRIERVLSEAAPDLVFHAAALKHVPMVEANPLEGVMTNVIGARNVADACRRSQVAAMVLISTDKAINPTSMMGATKRLAESYCQAQDIAERGTGTRFVTVRFGNVLGSTGSVVPLFQRQIAAGGPLSVTHPDMRRYFMTVSEAVELVLQASALGTGSPREEAGKIYVLDMGEPVKILDLARHMVRLSGLRPDRDIRIEITGLRPGEKLHEEIFHAGEPILKTSHPNLMLAAPRTVNLEILSRSLQDLSALAEKGKQSEAVALVKRLVPEYQLSEALEPTGHADRASGKNPA